MTKRKPSAWIAFFETLALVYLSIENAVDCAASLIGNDPSSVLSLDCTYFVEDLADFLIALWPEFCLDNGAGKPHLPRNIRKFGSAEREFRPNSGLKH